MTRARALKQLIRARAAKTGERYTTARRHVLKNLQSETVQKPRPSSAPQPAAASPAAKGSVSDEKSREKTGHGLEHWFAVLDQFGGVEKGHTAAARHLYDAYGVDGWYAQGITVAYERARGVRVLNQRRDGGYEVSVSKVLPVASADAVEAFTDAARRRRWIRSADADLVTALSAGLSGKASKGFVVKDNGHARIRYPWAGTIVEIYLTPKTGGKSTIVAVSKKLSNASMVDERRGQWKMVLTALALHLKE
jgi:hypothetical protein